MVKDYVRENSDGVMFVVDATMHGDDNQRNEDHILSEYMLNLEGTQGGVLVVLVDRAEEEVCIPVSRHMICKAVDVGETNPVTGRQVCCRDRTRHSEPSLKVWPKQAALCESLWPLIP